MLYTVLCTLVWGLAHVTAFPAEALQKRAPTTIVQQLTQASTDIVTNIQTYTVITNSTVSKVVTVTGVRTATSTVPTRVSSFVPSISTDVQFSTLTSTITHVDTTTIPVIGSLTLETVYPSAHTWTYTAGANQYSAYTTTLTTEVYQYSQTRIIQNIESYFTYIYASFTSYYTQVPSVMDLTTTQITFSQMTLVTSTNPTVSLTSISTLAYFNFYFETSTSTSTVTLTTEVLSVIPSVGTFEFMYTYTTTQQYTTPTTLGSSTMTSTSVQTVTSTDTVTSLVPTSAIEYSDESTVQLYNETYLEASTEESVVDVASEYTSTILSTRLVETVVAITKVTDIPDSSSVVSSVEIAPLSNSFGFASESSVESSSASSLPVTSSDNVVSSIISPVSSSFQAPVGWNSTASGSPPAVVVSSVVSSSQASLSSTPGKISSISSASPSNSGIGPESLVSPRVGAPGEPQTPPEETGSSAATPPGAPAASSGVEAAGTAAEPSSPGAPEEEQTSTITTTLYHGIRVTTTELIPPKPAAPGESSLAAAEAGNAPVAAQGGNAPGEARALAQPSITITTTISGDVVLGVIAANQASGTPPIVTPPLDIISTISHYSPGTHPSPGSPSSLPTVPQYGNGAASVLGPVWCAALAHLLVLLL